MKITEYLINYKTFSLYEGDEDLLKEILYNKKGHYAKNWHEEGEAFLLTHDGEELPTLEDCKLLLKKVEETFFKLGFKKEEEHLLKKAYQEYFDLIAFIMFVVFKTKQEYRAGTALLLQEKDKPEKEEVVSLKTKIKQKMEE